VNEKSFSFNSRYVIGLVILLLGIVLTLGNFDIVDSSQVLRFWPILLVVFGLIKMLEPGNGVGRIFGGGLAAVGAIMVLNRMDVIEFNFMGLWPLLLVAAGASLLLRKRDREQMKKSEVADDSVTGTAILSGIEQRSSTKHFNGGDISAILGGHVLDLRDADMPVGETAVLDVFACMGGIEIRVPVDWTVVLEGSAFMGGFESKARAQDAGSKRLVIKGQAIMGGVEVGN
jgi:predicted membrane protein